MNLRSIAGAFVLASTIAAPVQAVSIYGTAADLTGSRTSTGGGAGGLTGIGNWSTDFDVAWVIVGNGDGTYDYEYTFSGFGDPNKDISHVVIDLTDDCLSDPLCVTGATMDGESIDSENIEFGDFDGITGAVKLDAEEGSVYAFTSNRAPVWGHLALKDGGGSNTCADYSADGIYVCSNQLLGIGDDDDSINYIARPNGVGVVPVPAAVWLFGSALGLLGWVRRRG
ncbi:MAG: hypothetical protein ACR2QB_08495 [Gammaproteobacteria bacterium]